LPATKPEDKASNGNIARQAPVSIKQNSLLDQLRAQGRRIEKLSRLEHDLIKEVHPQVGEIKEGMEEMIAVVKENSENNLPASKKKGP
jgi:hypothetical protein